MEVLANAGIMALASMFVGVVPFTVGIMYAIWPSEHRLALMRPLSLATIFAAVSGTALGFINELRFIARTGGIVTVTPQILQGTAEGLMTLFFNFGCLTAAWLLVTVGLWRRSTP